MDLDIKIRRNEDKTVVLEMSGKLSLGEAVSLAQESIRTELRNGAKDIRLDMSAVSSVDSSGLGAIVSWLTTVRSQGGSLEVTGLNKQSATVIRMTGLEPVLNAPSPILPRDINTPWKSLGIAVVILFVAAAFYWIALR